MVVFYLIEQKIVLLKCDVNIVYIKTEIYKLLHTCTDLLT